MNAESLISSARASLKPNTMGRTALLSMGLRMGGMALFFLQAVLLARLLGPADYGAVSVALAIAELAAVIALSGMGIYAIREVSRMLALTDRPGVSALWRSGAATILAISAALIAILQIMAMVRGQGTSTLVLFALPLIPALALIAFMRGIVQASGQALQAQWPGEILRPLLVCSFLAAIVLFVRAPDIGTVMAAVLVSGLLAALAGYVQLRRLLATNGARPALPGEARRWRGEAAPLVGTALAQMLHLSLATLLLGALSGVHEAGLFQPVARIAPLLLIPGQAAAMHYAPQIAALWEQREIARLQGATRTYVRWSTAFTALIGLGLIVGGPLILLAFGPQFAGGTKMLMAVALAQVLASAIGPAGWLLSMTGRQTSQLRSYIAALAVQAALAFWLTPAHGAWGATLALCGGIVALPMLQAWQARRLLGLNSTILAKARA